MIKMGSIKWLKEEEVGELWSRLQRGIGIG
jgi:hypothetical protein